MRSQWRWTCAVLVLCALAGCGGPRASVQRETPPPAPKPAATHEIAETTIRFTDPKGKWKFQVKADRVEAATIHGPYDMTPATARYDEVSRPPVTMVAKHAHVDEDARRVVFEGDVHIASQEWRLDADRVEYDLKTGKVVASGRTKWVFAGESVLAPRSPSAPKDGKP
jgi:LPS export ABC transporter protein LptC